MGLFQVKGKHVEQLLYHIITYLAYFHKQLDYTLQKTVEGTVLITILNNNTNAPKSFVNTMKKLRYRFYIVHENTKTISLTSTSKKHLKLFNTKTVKQKKLYTI